jgi:hypothetical protein
MNMTAGIFELVILTRQLLYLDIDQFGDERAYIGTPWSSCCW